MSMAIIANLPKAKGLGKRKLAYSASEDIVGPTGTIATGLGACEGAVVTPYVNGGNTVLVQIDSISGGNVYLMAQSFIADTQVGAINAANTVKAAILAWGY